MSQPSAEKKKKQPVWLYGIAVFLAISGVQWFDRQSDLKNRMTEYCEKTMPAINQRIIESGNSVELNSTEVCECAADRWVSSLSFQTKLPLLSIIMKEPAESQNDKAKKALVACSVPSIFQQVLEE